jgi:hypothetical protein
VLSVNPYFSPGNNEIRIHGKCTLFWETLSFICEFIHGFVMQVVIFDSRVKTPQVGLYALAKALSQKGVAKKIQVIAKARVPIVKFVERKSEIAFDIRLNCVSHQIFLCF